MSGKYETMRNSVQKKYENETMRKMDGNRCRKCSANYFECVW